MQSLLALSRMAVGLGFLTIPKSFAALFAMPFTPEAAIGCRMAGTRDLVLGALLYTCRSQASTVITNDAKTDVANQQPQRKREWNDTQRALLLAAGVVVDAFDADVITRWGSVVVA
ncbi:hypothetical protein BDW59DRAFT_165274 [Aspergillus cavernicola]|uniref:Uncharacterized protein n=1 Tax=Aspergillus cavernicola TaxID=176166 RepID=A0ABR4HU28_9EURO